MFSKNTELIKSRAAELGAKVKDIIEERNLFYLEYKGKKIIVERSFFINRSSFIGVQTTKYKDVTHLLLDEAGLSTPKAAFFYGPKESDVAICRKLDDLSTPIIIKQLEGSNSKDVFPNINDLKDALKIIRSGLESEGRLMAQEMVYGREYRLLILGNKIIGALEMIPPCVFGNGVMTISELVAEKQKTLKRKLSLTGDLVDKVQEQGLELESIPKKGQRVDLSYYSSLSRGGETSDVLKSVHKDFWEIGEKVAIATGKYLCGIDIITDDISKSLESQKYHILEVNGRPDLTIHYNPNHGETQDVVSDILDFVVELKS